jgi:glycosyltransferase involved in cell wall biosynthesis
VVDGASQDRTADIGRDHAKNNGIVRLLEMPQNRGKGYWVRNRGMNAQGRIIRFPDADLSPPMEQALKLLAMLEAGADIAIGSRWMRQRTADYTPISGLARG